MVITCWELSRLTVDGEALNSVQVKHKESLLSIRTLQQEAEQAEVTIAATSQELLDAVEDGAPHIELQGHLDLTSEPMRDTMYWRMLNAETPAGASYLPESIRVCIKPHNHIFAPCSLESK